MPSDRPPRTRAVSSEQWPAAVRTHNTRRFNAPRLQLQKHRHRAGDRGPRFFTRLKKTPVWFSHVARAHRWVAPLTNPPGWSMTSDMTNDISV
eukprot:scaffold6107_cov130-Isochrysis_galbana.AAC.15